LDDGIREPKNSPDGGRWNILWSEESVEQVECNGETSNISCNIGEASQSRALEAMLGDGISDIVDCVVWDLKLVAICVGESSVW